MLKQVARRGTYFLTTESIKSTGLTIQRKSHLQNESLPVQQRRTEWKRPLWLVGFVIFITANLSGTIFQIGALPIVMLAPLGAVSLLYNALLARILLNDIFSHYMIIGERLHNCKSALADAGADVLLS